MICRRIKLILDKFRFIYYLVQFFLARLIAPLLRNRDEFKHLWIISERGTDARDNSYHLFRYICKNYPEINIKYIISKNSPDKDKVCKIGKTISYRSFLHMLAFVLSEVKISTHIMGFSADMYFFKILDLKKPVSGKKVFLQHGIILHDAPYLYAKSTNLDLFVCTAESEYAFIRSKFGYKEETLRCLGLCRFDTLPLDKNENKTKIILLMPTWRVYLKKLSKSSFEKSTYYKTYQALINNPKMIDMLNKYGYTLQIYLHPELQKRGNSFEIKGNRCFLLNEKRIDLQDMLIKADILITDYSSVAFDFAYMKKPVLYYQFDKKDFYSGHYQKGYFSYEKNGFGPVLEREDILLDNLEEVLSNGGRTEAMYMKRMDVFFGRRDHDNCERNFRAILEIIEGKRVDDKDL